MRGFVSNCVSALLWAWCAAAYFVVTTPTTGTQWVNGQVNVVQWTKGLLDNVNGYDVELVRINVDGLILVAKNVPAKPGGLNIYLNNVPAGDDYVLVFLNSTHGVLQGTSQRFTILPSSGSPTSAPVAPVDKAATVSVTSGPNPTAFFATTLPALPWSAATTIRLGGGAVWGVLAAVTVGLVSAGWVLMV